VLDDDLDETTIRRKIGDSRLLKDLVLVGLKERKIAKNHPFVVLIGQQELVEQAERMHEQKLGESATSGTEPEPATAG
jgi:hypothetical protein